MALGEWLARRGGVVRRSAAVAAGFRPAEFRGSGVHRIGRNWIALDSAPAELVTAARVGGRLACASAARRLGLALLEPPEAVHLWVPPHSKVPAEAGLRFHRSRLLTPLAPAELVLGVVDVLAHVAVCLPELEARIVWESALSKGLVRPALLRRIRWPGPRQRRLAELATDRSDSLLETIVAHRLREAGVAYRQQVRLLGRPVDFVLGERLVLQIDGYEFHRDAAQRRSDVEFDARLLIEGHPVIRTDYRAVVHDWPTLLGRLTQALLVA